MIQRPFIFEWREHAPWQLESQVEQDLILSRALVEIFSDEFLNDQFALRGGTALNKLFLKEHLRYSEDIDVVRTKTDKAKPVISRIQERLDSWLGKPSVKQNVASVTMIYRFDSSSEPVSKLRLKIEMNTRESKSSRPHIQKKFEVNSRWFSGSTTIRTYELEEILGSKLRALYRRTKGRDLLDFDYAFREYPKLDPKQITDIFHEYEKRDNQWVSRADFEQNLFKKMQNSKFLNDTTTLLVSAAKFDPNKAYALVLKNLAPYLPGKPWTGHPDSQKKD